MDGIRRAAGGDGWQIIMQIISVLLIFPFLTCSHKSAHTSMCIRWNSLCVSSSQVLLSAKRPPCGCQVENRIWDFSFQILTCFSFTKLYANISLLNVMSFWKKAWNVRNNKISKNLIFCKNYTYRLPNICFRNQKSYFWVEPTISLHSYTVPLVQWSTR